MSARAIPAPGVMVGGLHVIRNGASGPLVVFEAGIAASSLSWSLVQNQVARFSRTLSYDRAGFGWSEAPGVADATAVAAAHSLNHLLDALHVDEPALFVGHSFGALIVRVFQQQYPERVSGMILVDPVIRGEWRNGDARLLRGAMLSRRGATLAKLGVVGLALRLLTAGATRVPKLLAKASAGKAATVADRLVGEVRKMPREHWPAIAMHWSRARAFEAMAANLEQLPLSVCQVEEERVLGDLPLIVLSAKPSPEHRHDAALSTRGENTVVPETGHWIQLDKPEAVTDAIRKLVGCYGV